MRSTEAKPRDGIAAIILAAGLSKRAGLTNKLLFDIEGRPMIAKVVAQVIQVGLEPVLVVTGHELEAVTEAIGDFDLQYIHNFDYQEGMASSISCGIGALEENIEGAMICLGDMPWVQALTLERIVEAFYQYFLFDDIKGEMQPSHFNKVVKAAEFAKHVLDESIEKKHDTLWIEGKIPQILKILDLDALISIPLSVPLKGPGIAITPNDFTKAMKQVMKSRKEDFSEVDPENIIDGKSVFDEFKVIKTENKKNEKKCLNPGSIGIRIPDQTNVDETRIYDKDLINNLKSKFKEWKTGWKEYHLHVGDEFDSDAYLEGYDRPFISDLKKSIKTHVVILLDHSSSIADQQIDYKKATLALCEVLAFLKIKFSVYAFNTTERQVMCWLVKPEDLKWNISCAKRLAQIPANGGTPLAEVYDKMYPILHSRKPDIFLTLTDGEPSDPFAARSMVKSLKSIGIKMVAIGVGRDTSNATIIATNLKYLGFERTLGASRLNDIPKKVLNVLGDS